MTYTWDGFALDVAARRLVGPDGEVHLEPQAFDVLALLIAERARVVPKAAILDAVWGDQFVSESALTTRIKQVRRSLGDDGRTQKFVRNVHGRGYQFVGELTDIAPQQTEPGGDGESGPVRARSLAIDIAVDDEFPFVGRKAELDQIDGILRSGRGANSRVFIGGAPGSGKSRLAIEVLTMAAGNGATVCAGRCEASVTSSLQAVRDAFAQLAVNNRASLAGWSRGVEAQLVSLIPSLVDALPHDPVMVDAYAGIDVFLTVFERIAAGGPLLILVDDLQWSDEPTRSFLSRLHRRLPGESVATLTTYRSGRQDLPNDVYGWIQSECRSASSLKLALGNLDESAAKDLIEAVTGRATDPESEPLFATTGGHSLFLTESLRDLQLGQDTARSVKELVTRRLSRQNDDVRRIVQVGALLGPEFLFPIAATAADLEPETALAAVDLAIDAELLHETTTSSRFRFSHQLVPEAIVGDLTRARRASLHAACADALTEAGADEMEIAFHTLGAIPLVSADEAIAFSRRAATDAAGANQYDRAVRVLEAVLAVEPPTRVRAEVLLEIGELLNRRGTPGLAIDHLDQVIDLARHNGWPDLFLTATLAHWNRSPFRKPSDTSTLKLLAEADRLLGEDDSVDKARIMAKTAVFNIFRQPLSVRAAQVDQAIAMAEAVGMTDDARFELLEWRHITFSCPAGADRLDEIDVELERLRTASRAYFTDAAAPETSALMHGRGDQLRRSTLTDDVRIRAQPIAEWRDLSNRATFSAFEGDIGAARDLCERAAAIGDAFWGDSSFALHGFGQFFLDLIADEWTHSPALLRLLADFDGAAIFDGALITALHATGEVDEAETLAGDLDLSVLSTMGEHILGGNGLVGFAEAALRLDADEMAAAVEPCLAEFEHLVLGVPWACGLAAADPLARLAARRGDREAAGRYADIARSLYTGLGAPYLADRMDGYL